MLNKELETNVNRERILTRLAENLGIDFISDGSNLRKITDTYYQESIEFSNLIDNAISSGFITTMSNDFLDLFGRQYNIQRKRYNNISVYSGQELVRVLINKDEALITSFNSPTLLINKGMIIYSDENINIESLENVYLSDINEEKYISLRINMGIDINSYTIQEGTSFKILTTNQEVLSILPSLTLTFDKPIGLSVIEETIEDYKLRLIEATYIANNGANSLISSLTKEVPLISYIETENYVDGKGIKNLYVYTQNLIKNSTDSVINFYLIPMLESNLRNKIMYAQLINIKNPEPLLVNLEVKIDKKYLKPTLSLLNNITLLANQYFYKEKKVSKDMLYTFINTYLSEYNIKEEDYKFTFSSPYVSEEIFNLDNIVNEIEIPIGRFLYLSNIYIYEEDLST